MAGRAVEEGIAEQQQLVSFRAGTGAIEWARGGVTECLGPVDNDAPTAHVRCRVDGVVVSKKGWQEPRFKEMTLSVEGYQPRTGETTWSIDSTRSQAVDLVSGRYGPLIRDGRHLVVRTPAGPQLVSTRDGSVTTLDAADRFLCLEKARSIRYAMAWEGIQRRRAGRLVYPCTPDGRRAESAVTGEAVLMGGVPAGDLYLVATKAGVAAYDVSPAA